MGTNRADMIDAIEQKLQDTGNAIWTAAEIGTVIDNKCLAEVARYVPYIVQESLSTTAESWDLDIGSITDLVRRGNNIGELEFPVDKKPPRLREYSLVGDTLIMGINFEPSASETVYLHATKKHHLDADWEASTAYSVGDFVAPTTQNGKRYECTTAGTSDSSEPTWPTTAGGTVEDNTATWTCRAEDSTTFDDPILTSLFIDLVAARAALSKSVSYVSGMTLGNQFKELREWANQLLTITLAELRGMKKPELAIERPQGR